MAPKKKAATAENATEESFDERIARLETIVQEMEEGGLGLEQSIEHYREGVVLLKGCREVLGGYRRQVEELTEDAENALRPYEDDPDLEAEDSDEE
jgi:exodeoxyribonuclease VII small subunit